MIILVLIGIIAALVIRKIISNRKKNNSNGSLLCGEASPTYILNPKLAERIQKTMPEIKLIILVRNPVDRAFSHYNRALKLNKETAVEHYNQALSWADEQSQVTGP